MLGQLEVWWGIGSTHRQGPLWAQSLLYAATAAAPGRRRLHPLGCLTAIVAVSLAEFVAVRLTGGVRRRRCRPLIAAYTVGNRIESRRSWIGPGADRRPRRVVGGRSTR